MVLDDVIEQEFILGLSVRDELLGLCSSVGETAAFEVGFDVEFGIQICDCCCCPCYGGGNLLWMLVSF